jgi:hypothetical protein
MTRWDLQISDETDRSVRRFLARTRGAEEDSHLAVFVDDAVRRALFWETLELVWDRNKAISPIEAERVAESAVNEFRATQGS